MKHETLQSPVPVRFPKHTKEQVQEASRRFRLPVSEIIRRAVEQQLPTWEADGRMVITANAEN